MQKILITKKGTVWNLAQFVDIGTICIDRNEYYFWITFSNNSRLEVKRETKYATQTIRDNIIDFLNNDLKSLII